MLIRPNAESLPKDLLILIASFVRLDDLISFSETCKKWYQVSGLFANKREHATQLAHELRKHVVRGEQDQAENYLKLFSFTSLLNNKGTVIDYSGRKIYGTALQIALGAFDVYAEGKCDLISVPSSFTLDQIDSLMNSPAAYVRTGDKLFYRDRTNQKINVIKLDPTIIKQFDVELNPQPTAKRLSKTCLNKITRLTGHIHDESMVEMLQRYIRQLPNGEAKVAKQICEQFPPGWEMLEEERRNKDTAKLSQAIRSIVRAQSEVKWHLAVGNFKEYLADQNDGNRVITTGKHFNELLSAQAFKLYEEHYSQLGDYRDTKNIIIWSKIIGSILRYLPANEAQVLCQDPLFIFNLGLKLKRSFKCRIDNVDFYPLDLIPDFRIGYECGFLFGSGRFGKAALPSGISTLFKFFSTKSATLASMIAAARKYQADNPSDNIEKNIPALGQK